MTGSDTDVVLVRRQQHSMIITINRPKSRNSVNAEVSRRIGDAIDEADHDPEVRTVIITGTGDRAFCAGADLKALARGEAVVPEGSRWGFAGYVQHPISKPTIAAVNGLALGGGTEIVLASDLVVAAETAEFGLPEVKRGIMAGAGGPFRLVAQLPPKIAMEMLLTGATLDAATARRFGLVNRVCPADEVLDEALALAELIAANAPLAVQASKRVALGMRDGAVPAEQAAWELSHRESQQVKASADAREGSRAFLEKRAPNWQAQ